LIKIKDSWNRILKDYNIKELQFYEEYAKLYGDAKIFLKEEMVI